jgi:hypothetical protein
MDTATLTAEVGAVLNASGLVEAPCCPSGCPAGEGYAIEPMTQCGPDRVAVRWYPAACPDGFGLVLTSIADRLTTAGYLVEAVHAAPASYLAVLPPPGS